MDIFKNYFGFTQRTQTGRRANSSTTLRNNNETFLLGEGNVTSDNREPELH